MRNSIVTNPSTFTRSVQIVMEHASRPNSQNNFILDSEFGKYFVRFTGYVTCMVTHEIIEWRHVNPDKKNMDHLRDANIVAMIEINLHGDKRVQQIIVTRALADAMIRWCSGNASNGQKLYDPLAAIWLKENVSWSDELGHYYKLTDAFLEGLTGSLFFKNSQQSRLLENLTRHNFVEIFEGIRSGVDRMNGIIADMDGMMRKVSDPVWYPSNTNFYQYLIAAILMESSNIRDAINGFRRVNSARISMTDAEKIREVFVPKKTAEKKDKKDGEKGEEKKGENLKINNPWKL